MHGSATLSVFGEIDLLRELHKQRVQVVDQNPRFLLVRRRDVTDVGDGTEVLVDALLIVRFLGQRASYGEPVIALGIGVSYGGSFPFRLGFFLLSLSLSRSVVAV